MMCYQSHLRCVLLCAAVATFAWIDNSFGESADNRPQQSREAVVARPGSHWIEFRGKPVLLVGDSITQGWMELGENFDQKTYVDALARRGINLLLLWSYIGIDDQTHDPRIGYDAPELWPWLRDGRRFDLLKFNDTYFDRLRDLVAYANSKDIVVVITVHDGWTKTRFAGHPFNEANGGSLDDRKQFVELADAGREMPANLDRVFRRRQRHQLYLERFCERLIKATGDQPNVMYEMFNEGEWYNWRRLREFESHFLQFFRQRTAQPLIVNDDHVNGPRNLTSDADFDVLSLHLPRWDDQPRAKLFFDHFAAMFELEPARPVLFSETVPEFGGESSKQNGILRLLWGTAMAGAGVAFQNDASWGFDSRTTKSAKSAERDAVLDLEGHVARFFNGSGLDLRNLKPSGMLSSTGLCLAHEGTEYVIYADATDKAFTVDLTRATGVAFVMRWYDPKSGKFSLDSGVRGGSKVELRYTASGPVVLHLAKQTANN